VFQPDATIRFVPAAREQVVALVESINQAQVSIPGRSPQAVQGYLCGMRNPNGTFSIFVALHAPRTGENVVYLHPRRELSLEEYRTVEIEGLQFLESMGFMLDNLNFRNLGPAQQAEALKRIPLFHPPQPVAANVPAGEAGEGRPDQDRLARLLASV